MSVPVSTLLYVPADRRGRVGKVLGFVPWVVARSREGGAV
ncbi:hypothetical protein EDD35_1051 [Amycolatopsis thermoflava]|uniref:Uncharacterized protein n=1 Tax=Amycolatopsis thermoflava TaxID=84480 RepID=A0A3N2GQG6_9PSEU|nr:hypothetical protein EDD35_1051 [Amycolatopsis thermoflava]